MLLAQETKFNLDISSEAEVITYTYTGSEPRLMLARMDLSNIAGDGSYLGRVYLNGNEILPDFEIAVLSVTKITLQTRQLIIAPSDVLSITILGLPADTSVDVVSFVMDATPILAEDVTDIVGPDISDAVQKAIKKLTVTVEPTRVVLGPCQRGTVSMPQAIPQPVAKTPPQIR